MWSADVAARWRELSEEVIMGMAEWRVQGPAGTLREMNYLLIATGPRADGVAIPGVAGLFNGVAREL